MIGGMDLCELNYTIDRTVNDFARNMWTVTAPKQRCKPDVELTTCTGCVLCLQLWLLLSELHGPTE